MLWEYSYFILYFIFCLALALLILLLSYLLVNRAPNFEKAFPYECGFTPFGDARVQHDVSYYMVAISFIVFDVEIAFLYP
jgi:NADH-quinone oxidoreductase subunit A